MGDFVKLPLVELVEELHMDYGGRSGYAIEIIPDASAICPEPVAPSMNDQSIWATEDDYRAWNSDPFLEANSNSSNDLQSRAGSEPQSKKPRGSSQGELSKSKALGRMFFKTKLCCKFRAGTCPYVTNCNFAHGMEELRKPPPNWQEFVAAHQEGGLQEQREEHHIPISKARESVAISLSPTVGGASHSGGGGTSTQKPSNWKTRICNKWEMTGYCPFGSKCHFAHGAAELHKYGGGLVEIETRDASASTPESKLSNKAPNEASNLASNNSIPNADIYHMGVPQQRSNSLHHKQTQRTLQKYKGPERISRIYGDWIDDNE
ncbi:hypothetical protein HPP92_015975 [Vanilla planifolia]|uniref:C3H1-type domain-containing protein n=1 Tax=Vanilla planifolia TaxID=51239 RepID=A0A835QM69_VANPL|nr:hypothetical protein HPP92_015975 [Vanilla planifolia]